MIIRMSLHQIIASTHIYLKNEMEVLSFSNND